MQTFPIATTKPALASAIPRLSPVSSQIVRLIARYRFINSHLIAPLIQADPSYVRHSLRQLYQKKLVNRFRPSLPEQYIYYLDNRHALRQVCTTTDAIPEEFNWRAIDDNRQRDYATALQRHAYGQLDKIEHVLMINRFQAMLELGCRHSGGRVQLKSWQPEPPSHTFLAPKWPNEDKDERLTVKPDALFTLHFPEEQHDATFAYEADRNTMTSTAMTTKYRAYYQFVIKQKKHHQVWGIPHLRSVLTETVNLVAFNRRGRSAIHPAVRGITLEEIGLSPDQIEEQRWRNASTLFWFTHSDLLSENQSVGDRTLPLFVRQPEVIFSDAWINPRHPHQALSVLHP